MSAIHSHIRALRALGRAFHSVAEERMERAGKVAPVTQNECDRTAALTLGSMAQGFERAALDLEAEERALSDKLISGAPMPVDQ